MTSQVGASLGRKGAQKAGEVLSLAILRLLDRPDLIAQAKQELKAITEGHDCCLVPKNVCPPSGSFLLSRKNF